VYYDADGKEIERWKKHLQAQWATHPKSTLQSFTPSKKFAWFAHQIPIFFKIWNLPKKT
jgi:hypothetical protein